MNDSNNSVDLSNPPPAQENAEPEKKAPESITPEKKIKFSYFEPIAGIILAVVATIIFLVFPQIIAVVFIGGPVIPTFDVNVIRGLAVLIPAILWALFRIGVEVAYLVERRYTQRLAIITVVGNVLAAVCTLIMFIPYRIVFEGYISWVQTYLANVPWFEAIMLRPNIILLVIIMLGLILDSISVILKGKKSKGKQDKEEDGTKTNDVKIETAETAAGADAEVTVAAAEVNTDAAEVTVAATEGNADTTDV